MKNTLKTVAWTLLVCIALFNSACTKCKSCKHIASDGTVLWTWEVCNDKNGQDQIQTDCETSANTVPGSTCKCNVNFNF